MKKLSIGKGPAMAPASIPGATPASFGAPTVPRAPHPAGPRPRMRLRKLSMAGKSAFPTPPQAFGDPGAAAPPAQAFAGAGAPTGAGDTGE